ncbi:entericidin A/B family lipoprotein [Zavarzinia compransoris]|uniref:Entericidin n=1 Tax=Zavarzinia compransoris TaxID=1264899 RepID=A0A317E121_9PROT|nr:entericidin A/B family lipoprotein [Zavarzinia compransoris]PWR20758.1 entericidin [Zavarzinia compransoris]TDP44409.1 putative small secreted protein [Zavarzinia compransoris]
MKTLGLALILGLVALTAACNTIEGAGRDIKNTGDAISDTARDVKEKL